METHLKMHKINLWLEMEIIGNILPHFTKFNHILPPHFITTFYHNIYIYPYIGLNCHNRITKACFELSVYLLCIY